MVSDCYSLSKLILYSSKLIFAHHCMLQMEQSSNVHNHLSLEFAIGFLIGFPCSLPHPISKGRHMSILKAQNIEDTTHENKTENISQQEAAYRIQVGVEEFLTFGD